MVPEVLEKNGPKDSKMPALVYAKAERISLKASPDFTESWLQEQIAKDTSILGLGELRVLQRERRQERAGRLDMLLADEDECRYEVELMLGATDESHIIRAIEYWDIERRRFPGHDHVAVLVAEDITSRFLNVLSLFAGQIPFIGLQLSALKVGDQVVLNFAKVIDQRQLREDDETEADGGGVADRNYWAGRVGKASLDIADEIGGLVRVSCSESLGLNYGRNHLSFTNGSRSRNFIELWPSKLHVNIGVRTSAIGEWADRLEAAGISTFKGKRRVRFPVTAEIMKTHRGVLSEFFAHAWKEDEA